MVTYLRFVGCAMMPSIPDSEILVEFQAKYVQYKGEAEAALESAENFSREVDARNVSLRWHSAETLPSVHDLEQEQHEYEAQLATLIATLERIDTYVRDVFQDESASILLQEPAQMMLYRQSQIKRDEEELNEVLFNLKARLDHIEGHALMCFRQRVSRLKNGDQLGTYSAYLYDKLERYFPKVAHAFLQAREYQVFYREREGHVIVDVEEKPS